MLRGSANLTTTAAGDSKVLIGDYTGFFFSGMPKT